MPSVGESLQVPPVHGRGETPVAAVAEQFAGRPMNRRLIAAAVAVAAATVLIIAAFLTPVNAGLGTHEQLRLPACGWITSMGLPCPTCGMTTAFAHAANGNLLASMKAQPLGFLLALATAMALLVATHVAVTGSLLGDLIFRTWRPWMAVALVSLAVLAWVFKIIMYRGQLG